MGQTVVIKKKTAKKKTPQTAVAKKKYDRKNHKINQCKVNRYNHVDNRFLLSICN
jgi:hypothetical protein